MWRRLLKRPRRPSEQRVIRAALLIARDLAGEKPDEAAQIQALLAAGFDAGEAHRFVAFLPLAFSRPVMEALGIDVSFEIGMAAAEGTLTVRLDRQPEFVAGLALARRHRRSPCMPDWAYRVIAESTADIDAVNKALNDGAELEGAAMAGFIIGPDHAKFAVI